MILPPTKLIIGLCLFISIILLMAWFHRRRMRYYYNSLDSLRTQLSGVLHKKYKFWYDVPAFIGEFSGYQFTLIYGKPASLADPNRLYLYCRSTSHSETEETLSEELKKASIDQLLLGGWAYATFKNNELRTYTDLKLPIDPEWIKQTLKNLDALQRKHLSTPSTLT